MKSLIFKVKVLRLLVILYYRYTRLYKQRTLMVAILLPFILVPQLIVR